MPVPAPTVVSAPAIATFSDASAMEWRGVAEGFRRYLCPHFLANVDPPMPQGHAPVRIEIGRMKALRCS